MQYPRWAQSQEQLHLNGKKSLFISPVISPPPNQHRSPWSAENAWLAACHWRENGCTFHFLSQQSMFSEGCLKLVSVLPDCHSLVPGAIKSKGEYWLLESLKWCRGCHGSVKWGKGTQLTASSLGRRGKTRAYVPGFRFFGEVAQRTGFYLSWLEVCEPACFGCQGATENKGMKSGLQLQHLKE